MHDIIWLCFLSPVVQCMTPLVHVQRFSSFWIGVLLFLLLRWFWSHQFSRLASIVQDPTWNRGGNCFGTRNGRSGPAATWQPVGAGRQPFAIVAQPLRKMAADRSVIDVKHDQRTIASVWTDADRFFAEAKPFQNKIPGGVNSQFQLPRKTIFGTNETFGTLEVRHSVGEHLRGFHQVTLRFPKVSPFKAKR